MDMFSRLRLSLRRMWIDTSPGHLERAERKLIESNLQNQNIKRSQELVQISNGNFINTLHLEQDHTHDKTPVVI